MKLLAFALFAALTVSASTAQQSYPPHADVADVTKPPYSAAGDGKTDATESTGWSSRKASPTAGRT